MARIIWTDESLRWLRAIREHIAKDSPAAADRTVDGIFEKAQLLTTFPEIGFKYPLPGRDDVRVLVYGHYRIAYTFNESDTIHVLGVFHAALDIDRYFPELSD
jgi:plasmid stabilization system protein ParE